ncbi:formin-G [Cocos nucifera]|uniref:Formin-G n=1 Tax=Cocos nucifera TaxID=13894 RepID=A0A8K0MV68_COCNU|nr:formin-G [Cocos nucifera]
MVSDQEIASCVESLLRQSGPYAIASVNGVVRELEAKLGLDLSHKIVKQLWAYIRKNNLQDPNNKRKIICNDELRMVFETDCTDMFKMNKLLAKHIIPLESTRDPGPDSKKLKTTATEVVSATEPDADQYPVVVSDALANFFGTGEREMLQSEALRRVWDYYVYLHFFFFIAPAGVKRRGGPGGLSKVCGVSPQLQAIVGEPTMARTQIVKQLWAYIRKNNLQDPNNKRKIICNDELRMVFETDCTDMFKMNKLLAKHIIPLESTRDPGPDSKKLKTTATEVVSATEPDADQYPVVVSDALANFFGTGEREMLQSEALRRVWDYIKNNQLEEPMNTMIILCDSKLQQLFECESLSALGLSEMLSHHLFKRS